jgi:hypothetical protein
MKLPVRHSPRSPAKVISWYGTLVDLHGQKLAEACGGLPGRFVRIPR